MNVDTRSFFMDLVRLDVDRVARCVELAQEAHLGSSGASRVDVVRHWLKRANAIYSRHAEGFKTTPRMTITAIELAFCLTHATLFCADAEQHPTVGLLLFEARRLLSNVSAFLVEIETDALDPIPDSPKKRSTI